MAKVSLRIVVLVVACALAAGSAVAGDRPLNNWKPTTLTDVGHTSPFQPITPCRLVDTRGASGTWGGPYFAAGETRNYNIPLGPCSGIPIADAYSLNFTIIGYAGSSGWVTVYPALTTKPTTSTVNFGAGPAVANAAVIPSTSGSISVYVSAATHMLIDINGYYTNETPNGKYVGIYGSYGGGGLLFSQNDSTVGGASAIRGYASTAGTDGSGVRGEAYGTNQSFGMIGIHHENTPDSAGVLGWVGQRADPNYGFWPVGVRGEARNGIGVLALNSTVGAGGALIARNVDFTGPSPVLDSGAMLGYLNEGVRAYGTLSATGTKSFVDPHPTEAAKVIKYVAMEGPEVTTFFRGRGQFAGGNAVIAVPEVFRMETEQEGLTVHITPMGRMASVGVISADLNQIVVEANRDVEFSYIVYGIRRGYANFNPVVEGDMFMPESAAARLPKYLNDVQRQRLISNGTYNVDGTVNIDTAIRVGWAKLWDERARAATTSAQPAPQPASDAIAIPVRP